jgi:hypothetical protein
VKLVVNVLNLQRLLTLYRRVCGYKISSYISGSDDHLVERFTIHPSSVAAVPKIKATNIRD